MGTTKSAATVLEDLEIHVRIKLSALWTALTLCYLYGDFFGLFKPGRLEGMIQGKMGPLGQTTQGVLLGTSIMMSIPCLMVFLSLVLKPQASRWSNIVFGTIFTIIMLITMPGAWNFYIYLGVVEVVLTASIVWYAWTWPKQASA